MFITVKACYVTVFCSSYDQTTAGANILLPVGLFRFGLVSASGCCSGSAEIVIRKHIDLDFVYPNVLLYSIFGSLFRFCYAPTNFLIVTYIKPVILCRPLKFFVVVCTASGHVLYTMLLAVEVYHLMH